MKLKTFLTFRDSADEFIKQMLKKEQGRGRNKGDKQGAGVGGFCICPNCGYKEPHKTGYPCNELQCPNCGALMTRE